MRKLKCLPPCEQDIFEIPEGVSYYEQLCNFVYYLNDLIDSSEIYNQEIENLQNTTIVSPQGTMDVKKVTAENGVITFEIDISNKGEPYALTSTILYFNTDASRPITTNYQTAISVEDKTFYITTTQTRVINGTPTDDEDKKEVVTFSNSFDIYGNQVSISEGGITRDLIADGAINAQKIVDNTISNNNMVEKTLEVGSVSDDFINKLSYRPNLLINGDFQVNQRGQNTYTSLGTTIYTVDMWKINNGSVTVNDDGITFSGAGYFLSQFIDGNFANKTLTMVVKTSSDLHVITGVAVPDEYVQQQFSDIQLAFSYRSVENRLDLSVKNITASNDIKYIDLFEGSIAYPHVKEDYSIALIRCQSHVQIVGNINGNMTSSKTLIASLQTNLIAQPSITVNGGTIQVDGKFTGTATSANVQEYGKGSICLIIYSSSSESIDNGECGRFYGGQIILSCEPQ